MFGWLTRLRRALWIIDETKDYTERGISRRQALKAIGATAAGLVVGKVATGHVLGDHIEERRILQSTGTTEPWMGSHLSSTCAISGYGPDAFLVYDNKTKTWRAG